MITKIFNNTLSISIQEEHINIWKEEINIMNNQIAQLEFDLFTMKYEIFKYYYRIFCVNNKPSYLSGKFRGDLIPIDYTITQDMVNNFENTLNIPKTNTIPNVVTKFNQQLQKIKSYENQIQSTIDKLPKIHCNVLLYLLTNQTKKINTIIEQKLKVIEKKNIQNTDSLLNEYCQINYIKNNTKYKIDLNHIHSNIITSNMRKLISNKSNQDHIKLSNNKKIKHLSIILLVLFSFLVLLIFLKYIKNKKTLKSLKKNKKK